ncbi:MAG: DNA-directed RNA polymerase subunit omega [Candidatus Eisenbacteria bacterium]|nr:DNA-directed RNA polymerase subunit omega [Candidatus Eisenbacteria bacterium]
MADKRNEPKTMDSVSSFANRYELAVIAAKEARRINDILRRAGQELDDRVTLHALDKVQKGKVRYTYESLEGRGE